MPNEQFEHIEEIRNDFHQANERIRDSLNNTIKQLADGLYSRNPHFIFELIQNAEDNTYNNALPSLSFRLTKIDPTDTEGSEGALIIKNNETGFTPDDVDVICRAGESRKEKKQGYIGEKGIGFKSVFLVTDNPHIFSNGYHFRLPERDEETGFRYIVPQWTTLPEGFDPTQTHIILPLTKADFSYDEIEEMLLDIEPETFLFLSKLQEIHIKTDSGTHLSILKNDAAMPEVELLIEGEKQHRSFSRVDRFLVCTETANKPADIHHEKREEIENRDISIAFPLDENSSSVGKIFAYLPVRSDTRFPFLINADFILPSSREDIQDVPWNNWLMDCVANLVASMLLPALKERNLLTADFLEKLASRLNEFEEGNSGTSYMADRDGMFRLIFARVREAFMNEQLLPANDGTFVSASNAKLARGDAIRNLLSDEQLGDLFDLSNGLKWLFSEITLDRTPDLWQYLRYKLEIEEVDPEMFARRLSEQFLEHQCDGWFIDFYKFLTGQRALWSSPWSTLRSKPILRLQDRTHVNPPREDGASRSAYLASEAYTDTPSPIIKVELTQNEEVRGLLRELGVREREIVDDVIEHVLPKYESDSRIIHVEEHRTDFEKILHAYNTGSEANRIRLRDKLQETPFILTKNSNTKRPIYRNPKQLYFESDELRMYFEGNDASAFVNLDEYPDSARELLECVEVKADLRVERRPQNVYGHIVVHSGWGWHVRGFDKFDPGMKVDGLEHALNHRTLKKSAFIWNNIARPNSSCIRGVVESSKNQEFRNSSTEERISYDFGRLLIETAWLPDDSTDDSTDEMRRPCELTLDDLPPSFERDVALAEQLGMKRNEVAELAEKVGISVEWIEVLKRPGILEKFKDLLALEDEGGVDPKFPVGPVKNRKRRATMLDKELKNMPAKEYARLLRSVRVNSVREVAREWLKAEYTNDDEQMICQICQKEMPFKKRDGEYYFEAVEALDGEHFPGEHEQQFLAFCPECAARFQEFIKNDENAMKEMIDQLMASDNLQVPLQLGELKTNLRFVEKHWRDIKQILESA